jgi:hypothetical protein
VAGEHLVYDLDATGDHWIALNANLSSGSGKSDIELLIPESFFDSSVPYVYLYSAFGLQGDGWASGNGNEEWAVAGGRSGRAAARRPRSTSPRSPRLTAAPPITPARSSPIR